jgi:hypothetical protein
MPYSKLLHHGADGFTCPPKERVLRISIALKNPSSSAGYEPANFGFSGRHVNFYTTEENTETYVVNVLTFYGDKCSTPLLSKCIYQRQP